MPAGPPVIVAHVKNAGELPVYGLIISWRHGGAPGAGTSARHHSCQVNSTTAPSQCPAGANAAVFGAVAFFWGVAGVCWRARPDGKLDEIPPGQVPPRTWWRCPVV